MAQEKKDNANTIFCVLGMHRSATSLTAMLLSMLGIYIGTEEELLSSTADNEKGYYERKDVVQIDDDILLENNAIWCSVLRLSTKLSTEKEDGIDEILRRMQNDAYDKNIALKDPRLCLLEPLWRKGASRLSLHERAVVVFRHPYEVAESIERRDGLDFCYSLLLWLYDNYTMIKNIIDLPDEDILVLNNEDYFHNTDRQLRNLARFAGVEEYGDLYDAIDGSLMHHNKNTICREVPKELDGMVHDMHAMLTRWASEEHVKPSKDMLAEYETYIDKEVRGFFHKMNHMPMPELQHGKNRYIKQWCMFQMTEHRTKSRETLSKVLKTQLDIKELALYGNGMVAREMFGILADMGITVTKIYVSTENRIRQEEYDGDISVLSVENIIANQWEYILNTVVQEDGNVYELLKDKIEPQHFISLFAVLYKGIWETA